MAFSSFTTALIKGGKEVLYTLFDLARTNFADHETRILALESPAFSVFPAGMILDFGGGTLPTGWLACDGSEVSQTTYAGLYAAIGTAYNDGTEAAGNFRLPDSRGRIFIGAGTGTGLTARTLGQRVGAETHTLVESELPAHSHTVTDPGHTHTVPTEETIVGGTSDNFMTLGTYANTGPNSGLATNSATTDLSLAAAGGGGAHNNVQPSLVVNAMIKT